MTKKNILLLCIFICSVSLVFAKGKSDTNKTKATVQGYVISLGNEPFTYPGIKTNDGKRYTIIAKDKLKKELLTLQGKEIKFKGKLLNKSDTILSLDDGEFELDSYKLIK